MSIEKEVKGYFQCPNCRARFETEEKLKMHFNVNPICDQYAEYLLTKAKLLQNNFIAED